MRKLVILRGPMGCGKSTFIKEHDLECFTLSSDLIRLMLNAPQLNTDYSENIPQFNNKKVWELLYSLLEERMKKGEFTIVDAVHLRSDESFPIYKKLASKYRYRLYVLDFTQISKEEVYKRNRSRETYKIVSERAIDRVYGSFSKEKVPTSFKVVVPENFEDIIKNEPRDLNHYNKVHVIGDVHGCYSALKRYFDENPINDNDGYIFVGDYFDRGIENCETFRYLMELSNRDNVTLLVGNHEDKLYKYACDDPYKLDYDIKNTVRDFESNGIEKSEIRGFIKKLAQISYIIFGGRTYLINHGGIPYIPKKSLDFYSTDSFIYGIDKYEVNIDKIYSDYMAREEKKVYQIHGHRNFHRIKFDEYEYSLNLDGDVEHGGYLRVLTLNKDASCECMEIENTVYNPHLKEETKVYDLVTQLRKNKYIFEKELGDGISSFNFSKEAFYNKIWDDMTTRARGLFIDVDSSKLIARSYNKFFKVNERKETNFEEILERITFPVKFYLKYNGFLGILSFKDGELFFASKSTNVGNYVEYFKTIFYNTFDEIQIEALKKKMKMDDLTVLFEVIDADNDPHIIEYEESKIVLLDMVFNKVDYSKVPYDDLKEFAEANGIAYKELVYTVWDREDFKKVYELVTSPDYKLNDKYVEGFVIEDYDNFMVKTKSSYYNKWKNLRYKMENALKNGDYSCKSGDVMEKSFLEYLSSKYENRKIDIDKVDIISERREFENKSSDSINN